jgi:formate hydrogenlyase subunit 6/NADH:ubiquinone oxidoreductase subunit I
MEIPYSVSTASDISYRIDVTENMGIIKDLLENLGKRPSTILYPAGKEEIIEGTRTKVKWEINKCIGCSLCEKICPGFAISLLGSGKRSEIKYYVSRCIFCGECMEVCPTQAIQASTDPKYVYSKKEDMTIEFRRKEEDLI